MRVGSPPRALVTPPRAPSGSRAAPPNETASPGALGQLIGEDQQVLGGCRRSASRWVAGGVWRVDAAMIGFRQNRSSESLVQARARARAKRGSHPPRPSAGSLQERALRLDLRLDAAANVSAHVDDRAIVDFVVHGPARAALSDDAPAGQVVLGQLHHTVGEHGVGDFDEARDVCPFQVIDVVVTFDAVLLGGGAAGEEGQGGTRPASAGAETGPQHPSKKREGNQLGEPA